VPRSFIGKLNLFVEQYVGGLVTPFFNSYLRGWELLQPDRFFYNPNLNRPGSVQAVANDCTHPHQSECYSKQSESLYWHLNFFKHLEQLPELKLPNAQDFTLHRRCAETNLRRLQENFEVNSPRTHWCRRVVGDLLTFKEADLIAHQVDCESFTLQGLAADIAQQLDVSALTGRTVDPVNPLLAESSSRPSPGTINVVWSPTGSLWVAHLFAQRSNTPPNREEDSTSRIAWFQRCLMLLSHFVQTNGLRTVAFPYGIGCKYAGGAWSRYEQLLESWASEHVGEFTVFIVAR